MALKLKLKMPSSSASNSPQPPPPESHSPEQPKLPKLKIKAPSKTPVSSTPDSSMALKRPQEEQSTGENPKKLKLSLSKTKENGRPKGLPRVRIKPTRIPGEGYDSEAPDLEDDPLIEQGIIIRFLNDSNLDFVHNAVDSGDLTGLNVKWVTKEKAIVNVNSILYSARLIDLPTVTEIFKTVDRKNVFKTLDICQILLVLHVVDPAKLNIDTDFEVPQEFLFNHPFYKYVKNNEIKKKRMVLKDGLLQPFQDVYRRFRPTKVDHRVILDIESKVDELIKLDNEADESHFELLDSKTAQQSRFGTSATPSAVNSPVAMRMEGPEVEPGRFSNVQDHENEEDDEEEDEEDYDDDDLQDDDMELHLEQELEKVLDGELSESEVTIPTLMAGILTNDVGNGISIMTNGEQSEDIDGDEQDDEEEEEEEEEDGDDEEEEEEEEEEENEEGDSESGKQHVKLLEEEIFELEKAVAHHQKNLSTASSKMLRMKFQNTYTSLKASLDLKKRDLAKLLDEQEQQQEQKQPKTTVDEKSQEAEHSVEAEAEIEAQVEADAEDGDEDEDIDQGDDMNQENNNNNGDLDIDEDNADDLDDLF